MEVIHTREPCGAAMRKGDLDGHNDINDTNDIANGERRRRTTLPQPHNAQNCPQERVLDMLALVYLRRFITITVS